MGAQATEAAAARRPIASVAMAIASLVDAGSFISQLLEARHEPLEYGCMNVGRSLSARMFWGSSGPQLSKIML
jgi:hypothetical protein